MPHRLAVSVAERVEPQMAVTWTPRRLRASIWTGPMKPVPMMPARREWRGIGMGSGVWGSRSWGAVRSVRRTCWETARPIANLRTRRRPENRYPSESTTPRRLSGTRPGLVLSPYLPILRRVRETWFHLDSGIQAPEMNMAVDEALLEAAAALGSPILRTYGWSLPAATFGYFQRHAEIAALTALDRKSTRLNSSHRT